MEEKIIPEKEPLFQTRIQKKPVQSIPQNKSVRQSLEKKKSQEEKGEKPVFNIPQPRMQKQPEQAILEQQVKVQSPGIVGWRKWIIIVAVALIVIGLGIYFLAG